MNLEKWVEYGRLREEPTGPDEIADLLGIITRALHDAAVEQISEDLRFQAAFSAALTAANVALRAFGYRTRVQTGHHQKLLESLEFTIHADASLIQRLRVLSKKRNAAMYDTSGVVSSQDLKTMMQTAVEMQTSVTDWLKANHPELLVRPR